MKFQIFRHAIEVKPSLTDSGLDVIADKLKDRSEFGQVCITPDGLAVVVRLRKLKEEVDALEDALDLGFYAVSKGQVRRIRDLLRHPRVKVGHSGG